MARKSFFDQFSTLEKKKGKSFSFKASTWELLEAYQLYGSSQTESDIKTSDLVERMILGHIERDKNFIASKQEWLSSISKIKNTAKFSKSSSGSENSTGDIAPS